MQSVTIPEMKQETKWIAKPIEQLPIIVSLQPQKVQSVSCLPSQPRTLCLPFGILVVISEAQVFLLILGDIRSATNKYTKILGINEIWGHPI